MSWFTDMFGVVPALPLRCSMTDAEWRSRQNRWKRRYPNLETWLAAHPGQAAGQLIGEMPPVTYWKSPGDHGWAWCWAPTAWASIPPRGAEVTEAEFRAGLISSRRWGLTEKEAETRGVYVPVPDYGEKPSWPPTPEQYMPGKMTKQRRPRKERNATRRIPTTKAEAITDILGLMTGFGITLEDLKPKAVNGYAKRYAELTAQLRGTSLTLPPFEAWVARIQRMGG